MTDENFSILVPRSSISFGHVVGETEALVSAVTGCPKIPDIHSLIRVAHSFFITRATRFQRKEKKTRSSGNEDEAFHTSNFILEAYRVLVTWFRLLFSGTERV